MRAKKLLAAAGLVLYAGCGGLGKYGKDRGNDLLDCFTLEAGLGLFADVEVHATDLVATGAGWAVSGKFGPHGRERVQGYTHGVDEHVGVPFFPGLLALLHCWDVHRSTPESDLHALMARGPWLLRALITDCSDRNFTPNPHFSPGI